MSTPYAGGILVKTVIFLRPWNCKPAWWTPFNCFPVTVIIHPKPLPHSACVQETERALILVTYLSVQCFEYHLPSSFSTSPSLLSTLSPFAFLLLVSSDRGSGSSWWPLTPSGHLGRYAGRWGLCRRATRTLRKHGWVLIRWRWKTEEEEVVVCYCDFRWFLFHIQ